jgi:hypothetical protein
LFHPRKRCTRPASRSLPIPCSERCRTFQSAVVISFSGSSSALSSARTSFSSLAPSAGEDARPLAEPIDEDDVDVDIPVPVRCAGATVRAGDLLRTGDAERCLAAVDGAGGELAALVAVRVGDLELRAVVAPEVEVEVEVEAEVEAEEEEAEVEDEAKAGLGDLLRDAAEDGGPARLLEDEEDEADVERVLKPAAPELVEEVEVRFTDEDATVALVASDGVVADRCAARLRACCAARSASARRSSSLLALLAR